MRKFDKVSARLSFSPKYCRAVVKNAIKTFIFMHDEARSIFLGSKDVPNLVYFWVAYTFGVRNALNLVYFLAFQKYPVSDPPPPSRHIPIEVSPWGGDLIVRGLTRAFIIFYLSKHQYQQMRYLCSCKQSMNILKLISH